LDKPCDCGEATGRSALMAGVMVANASASDSASGGINLCVTALLLSWLDKFIRCLPVLFSVADFYRRAEANECRLTKLMLVLTVALLSTLLVFVMGSQAIAPLAMRHVT
jgi:hypothetical protein